MTRDAKRQSVECSGHHDWIVAGFTSPKPDGQICCSLCNHFVTNREREQAEAVISLKKLIKPGDTVYTTLRHVSRSGMQRVIDVHIIQDNEPRWIGYTVAKAQECRFDDRKQGIIIGGCGMDMGFEIVYNLGRILFPAFECLGKGDGGYSLKQRWL